jgi:hypothetical protein
MIRPILTVAFLALSLTAAHAKDRPMLEILWPQPGAVIKLGSDPEKAIGVVVKSNFALFPALKCAANQQCGQRPHEDRPQREFLQHPRSALQQHEQ